MAKGQIAKKEIIDKILETFGKDAFLYNDGKEVRVNTQENGELVQIKLTFTAAKTPVNQGDDTALPGTIETKTTEFVETSEPAQIKTDAVYIEPSKEEKENVKSLLEALGL